MRSWHRHNLDELRARSLGHAFDHQRDSHYNAIHPHDREDSPDKRY